MGFPTADDAEAAFYRAFSFCDLDAMREIWCRDTDVTCIHPLSAPLTGFDAIIRSWEQIFRNMGPTRILSEQLHRSNWQEAALHVVKEHFEVQGGGTTPVIATNAYRLTADGWRMVLHHGSPSQRPSNGPPPTTTRRTTH